MMGIKEGRQERLDVRQQSCKEFVYTTNNFHTIFANFPCEGKRLIEKGKLLVIEG